MWGWGTGLQEMVHWAPAINASLTSNHQSYFSLGLGSQPGPGWSVLGSELLGIGSEDRESQLGPGSSLVSSVERSEQEGER